MNIFLDIETLRSSEKNRLEILDEVRNNFKAPTSLTKVQAAADLGIKDKDEIKFTAKSVMISLWEKELATEKSESVAQDKWEKTSFNPEVSEIACICIGWYDGDIYKKAAFAQDDFVNELEMLEEFHFTINNICSRHGAQITKPKFIGHNIAKFDLPFLWKRSVINGVETCKDVKWIDSRHSVNCFDTMIAWAGFGKSISADNLCKILNLKGKTKGMDGSKVFDTWQVDKQKVIDYCCDDVALVKEIYKRLNK